MSLWTRFRDAVVGIAAPAVGVALGGPLGGVIGGVLTQRGPKPTLRAPAQGFPGTLPSFPGVGVDPRQQMVAVLPTIVRTAHNVLRSPAVRAGAAAAAGALLGEAVDINGAPIRTRKKYRRMNAQNPKALKRAVRRLSAYSKMNKKIESELRKIAPRPARRARYSPPHRPG